MENWYIPITIIPGIGLIILLTSNLMMTLNNEISTLITTDKENKTIISQKLLQLKLLNRSMVCFYIAVACLVIAGLISGLERSSYSKTEIPTYISIIGILIFLFGLISLIIYSYKAVSIRQSQFKNLLN